MKAFLKRFAALLACAVGVAGIANPLPPASPLASVASAAAPASASPTDGRFGDQVSNAAASYGGWSFALIGAAVVVGLVAWQWKNIKALAAQAKPAADPIAEALELAKQLDALHVKLGLPVNEREAALADVITRAFKVQA